MIVSVLQMFMQLYIFTKIIKKMEFEQKIIFIH